jgi:ubiquinone biosynthesis UbiH/UbiF/VisC/COQ6 family hydroxylase
MRQLLMLPMFCSKVDVIVVGGGLVGASLAIALGRAGAEVAIVEPQPPDRVPAGDGSWDSRVYAVSPGSASFLESCGAWQRLAGERIARVESMQVFGDAPGARLEFNAYDCGLRELAFIVETSGLSLALWEELRAAENVRVRAPARCETLARALDTAILTLTDGTALAAQLIVAADGADSWVRRAAGIATHPVPYGQLGVVANFAIERPHHGTAYQWFRRDGVLALLPLAGAFVSMVWSTPEAHGRELSALAPEELAARVEAASLGKLGALRVVTPAASFALQLQRVAQLVAPRLALVGDAAHNVHPLAGQGVNLGFRDARELARVLATRGAQSDFGDYHLLRRYERARREDILAMQLATDGLQKLFASEEVWLHKARNLGLHLTNLPTPLKRWLVQRAVA